MDLVENSSDLKSPYEIQPHEASKNYRVLPLFEKDDYEARAMQRYSLLNNEKMAKEWSRRTRGRGVEATEKIVREFPDINDYHYKNFLTQFIPALSYKNYKPPHFHLTPGPGSDKYGQRPIPIDMLLRKSENVNPRKCKLEKKSGNPKKH